jgi:hypothetical protein
VFVRVAGAADGVAEEVSGRAASGVDQDVAGFEVGEEFLGAGGVGDGGADAVLEPFAAGLFPSEAFGLVHLGLGGASGAGAVALLQPAQAVVFLDLPALVADADPAVVELGAASVFADGGGEDVDVVVGVADGDPAAGRVVDGGGDAGGLAVLITSVVDTCCACLQVKTSGVVELSRTAPHGGLRVPP